MLSSSDHIPSSSSPTDHLEELGSGLIARSRSEVIFPRPTTTTKAVHDVSALLSADPSIALDALHLICSQCRADGDRTSAQANCQAIFEADCHVMILAAMAIHQHIPFIQASACGALQNLCFFYPPARSAVGQTAIQQIVKSMQAMTGEVKVQKRAIGALATITMDCYPNKAFLVESKGLLLVLENMEKYFDHGPLQRRACYLLYNVSQEWKLQHEIVLHRGLDLVVRALASFPDDPILQEKGRQTKDSLKCYAKALLKKYAGKRLAEDDPARVAYTLSTLKAMARDASVSELIYAARGHLGILYAVDFHQKDFAIQQYGTSALYHLSCHTLSDQDTQLHIGRAVIPSLIGILRRAPLVYLVQVNVWYTLANLMTSCKANTMIVLNHDGLDLLAKALSTFQTKEGQLKVIGFWILNHVCQWEDFHPDLIQSTRVVAVLRSMVATAPMDSNFYQTGHRMLHLLKINW